MKKYLFLFLPLVLIGCAEKVVPVYDPQPFINSIRSEENLTIKIKTQGVDKKLSGAAYIKAHDADYLIQTYKVKGLSHD